MNDNRDINVTQDQVLALAGMIQSVSLVQQVARQGYFAETVAFQTCIESIFTTEANTVEEVYGEISGLFLGLRLIRYHLGGTMDMPSTSLDRERASYFLSLIRLERQLQRSPAILARIGAGIELARNQARHIPRTHPDIVASLASLYTETIANLGSRILISGEEEYLTRTENAHTIRALLLAGIRSAVLFYQRGGRRWTLIIHRNALLEKVAGLLKSFVN